MGCVLYYYNFQIRVTYRPRSAVGYRSCSFSCSPLHATATFRLYWNNASGKKQKLLLLFISKKEIYNFFYVYTYAEKFLVLLFRELLTRQDRFFIHAKWLRFLLRRSCRYRRSMLMCFSFLSSMSRERTCLFLMPYNNRHRSIVRIF